MKLLIIPKIVKSAYRGLLAYYRPMESGTFFPRDNQISFEFENDDYAVTVNGKECPVRACRVSAKPFNRTWPGKQRDMSQTELASFVFFEADEDVTLSVKVKDDFDKAVIRPLDKDVNFVRSGNEITFTLTQQGSYVLEPFGEHRVLHIFFNAVKEYPDAKKATYYFGPGLHFPGCITLRDNDTVYIDREAIVFGSLYSEGCKNVRIYGGGILDNSNEERIVEHCYENFTKGTMRIYNSENIRVEDIIMLNSSTWILSMFYCKNVSIDGVKLVGHWRYNTDGIDIVNSSNVTIKNSFVRSFDDTITIKGIYGYPSAIENITVDNCVLWCGWGYTLELGVETDCRQIKNVTFKNCRCIHVSNAALAIPSDHLAEIFGITYENISVEFQQYTRAQVYQHTDDMRFEDYVSPCRHYLAVIRNKPLPDGKTLDNPDNHSGMGNIYNIRFKNIKVYTDTEEQRPYINVHSAIDGCEFHDVEFDGLYLNGKRQSDFSSFDVNFVNTQAVVIK